MFYIIVITRCSSRFLFKIKSGFFFSFLTRGRACIVVFSRNSQEIVWIKYLAGCDWPYLHYRHLKNVDREHVYYRYSTQRKKFILYGEIYEFMLLIAYVLTFSSLVIQNRDLLEPSLWRAYVLHYINHVFLFWRYCCSCWGRESGLEKVGAGGCDDVLFFTCLGFPGNLLWRWLPYLPLLVVCLLRRELWRPQFS